MSKQKHQPTTLAEQRARDLSPWRRVFTRRGGRSAWFASLSVSVCLGAYAAWRMLHLGVTTPVRELLPVDPPPTFFVEIRDAARITDIDWVRQDLLDPLLARAIDHPDYGPDIADALGGAPARWPAIGAALGDDAVVARYEGGDTGEASTLMIVATRPTARLWLAKEALYGRWTKDEGLTRAEVGVTGVVIHYATLGRLVVASTDADLVRRALAVIRGAEGFLAARSSDPPSLLALRAADQSPGRSASCYTRSARGETLAEVSVHRGDWSASIWTPGVPILAPTEAVASARAEARRVATASSAVFWHAAVSVSALRSLLADSVGLTWQAPANLSVSVPIVLTIPTGEASGAILPELAVTALTPAAEAAREALVTGATEVVFRGSPAKVKRDGDGVSIGLPLGFGLRYPVHMQARPGALTFATTRRALTPTPGAGMAGISVSTQRQADLFQLVADGPALHTVMARTLALMRLAQPPSPSLSFASGLVAPLLARSRTIVASGVSAPDGFRVDIHGSVAPSPGSAP